MILLSLKGENSIISKMVPRITVYRKDVYLSNNYLLFSLSLNTGLYVLEDTVNRSPFSSLFHEHFHLRSPELRQALK